MHKFEEIMKNADRIYKYEDNVDAFHEEVGELMTKISHLRRNRCNIEDVVEEIVDVRMMLDILVRNYEESHGLTPEMYDVIENTKYEKMKLDLQKKNVKNIT